MPTEGFVATALALAGQGKRLALLAFASPDLSRLPPLSVVNMQAMPRQADAYAYALYAALRAADGSGADLILMQSPPDVDPWSGVNDRLKRSAFAWTGLIDKLLGAP